MSAATLQNANGTITSPSNSPEKSVSSQLDHGTFGILGNGVVNDGVLEHSIELYPPREFLLRDSSSHSSSPSRSSSRSNSRSRSTSISSATSVELRSKSNSTTSSPLRMSNQTGVRPSDMIDLNELNHALSQVAQNIEDTKQGGVRSRGTSPVRRSIGGGGGGAAGGGVVRRGTLLGSYMFMVKAADKKLLDKYTVEDLQTLIKQLKLLKLQVGLCPS